MAGQETLSKSQLALSLQQKQSNKPFPLLVRFRGLLFFCLLHTRLIWKIYTWKSKQNACKKYSQKPQCKFSDWTHVCCHIFNGCELPTDKIQRSWLSILPSQLHLSGAIEFTINIRSCGGQQKSFKRRLHSTTSWTYYFASLSPSFSQCCAGASSSNPHIICGLLQWLATKFSDLYSTFHDSPMIITHKYTHLSLSSHYPAQAILISLQTYCNDYSTQHNISPTASPNAPFLNTVRERDYKQMWSELSFAFKVLEYLIMHNFKQDGTSHFHILPCIILILAFFAPKTLTC